MGVTVVNNKPSVPNNLISFNVLRGGSKQESKFLEPILSCRKSTMAPTRLNPSVIGNKMKREHVYRTAKREKKQEKLKRRMQQAEFEKKNPELREVRSYISRLQM